MKPYLHGPMDFAKTLKLRFRVGLDMIGIRKRYTSSPEEESAQVCPCGEAKESDMCKEERGVLEEQMKKRNECHIYGEFLYTRQ